MTNEPSPRPWQVIKMLGIDEEVESVFVADANNSAIARMVAYAENDKANAALIVSAVNERDRLRDIMRRLADSLQGIMDAADGKGEGVLDESLLRDARAALGEGETPTGKGVGR